MLLQIFRRLHTSTPLLFRTTPQTLKEPQKRKKRIDPAILKAKEDRTRRRIMKEIKRLQKMTKQFKPIDELILPYEIENTKEMRQREKVEYSDEQIWEDHLTTKAWNQYKLMQSRETQLNIASLVESSERALQELRSVSEELYQAAIQLDDSLFPFTSTGPVSTPPIPTYVVPDGKYTNITKVWE